MHPKLLGPIVPGTTVEHGARVPGTQFVLDPVTAAFNIAAMVRWLDFSDTWITPQTSHPSDDVGAILAVADYVSRVNVAAGRRPFTIGVVLDAMIKAHELQGSLGAHVRLSETGDRSSVAAESCMCGGDGEIARRDARADRRRDVARFFRASLCVHRFGSNVGPRKGWAAADSTSHGVRLAMMAMKGEPGYPQILTQPKWGFNQWFLGGREFKMASSARR